MARVIYTGPLNPVIFARAKKEAEKAECIKGYRPRVIKTPSHTVVYSKTGQEVKAVVMDMLTPITFSIPGSAIPVRPNFLHLHPDLPEKVYGKTSNVVINGFPFQGIALNPATVLTLSAPIEADAFVNRGIGGGPVSVAKFIWGNTGGVNFPGNIDNATDIQTIFGHDSSYGGKKAKYHGYGYGYYGYSYGFGYFNKLKDRLGYYSYSGNSSPGGSISIHRTGSSTHYSSSSVFNGSLHIDNENGIKKMLYSFSQSTVRNGSFLAENIRMYVSKPFIVNDVSRNVLNTSVISEFNSNKVSSEKTNQNTKSDFSLSVESIVDGTEAVNYNGGVVFPFVKMDSSYKAIASSQIGSEDVTHNIENKYTISCGVFSNLGIGKTYAKSVCDISVDFNSSSGSDPYIDAVRYYIDNPKRFLYVAGSCNDFDGVFISCKTHNKWPVRFDDNQFSYDEDSVFSKSHLAYYFDFFRGKYTASAPPHLREPRLTTDGICLPHAWFFCRGNETQLTDFYPNNHNRLSIVIYPQGRHEFSVDEAEIVSVELNHTPRFVARPGGGIEFVMQSLFGGNKLVPYVVNGLVEERDEYGEPTGFYLAQDGAISGEFKAPTSGGDPVVSFKLSPRQAFDGYRTVTVEATTERKYGVQTTFEVRGGGGVRVQQPPSITLERINEIVLAGQLTVFYVTATQIAAGSYLRYEVKRAGAVVSAGYIRLENCAGWIGFAAPAQYVSVPGDSVRYVLADSSAPSTTPSTVEFEFSLVHEQAPPPVTFSVKFAHELYASSTDRPDALPMPPLFFLQPLVSENGEENFLAANYQTTLINRIYYSLQSKRVYVLFWDGQSCDVSGILKKNQESGQYEYNPDWKETSFDYPPAVDPYNIKGTLEPYVYAYMDYENNRNNGA